MSDKRIYDLTEASVVGADDFLALDSSEFSETKKIKLSTLTNGLVFKESLTNLIINSDTNNTGSTITKGTVFYLYGELCIALVDIASGAEFTPDTNYNNITVGGQIADLKSALSVEELSPSLLTFPLDTSDKTVKFYKMGKLRMLSFMLSQRTHSEDEVFIQIPSEHRPISTCFQTAEIFGGAIGVRMQAYGSGDVVVFSIDNDTAIAQARMYGNFVWFAE
jgi:hypothetical protein